MKNWNVRSQKSWPTKSCAYARGAKGAVRRAREPRVRAFPPHLEPTGGSRVAGHHRDRDNERIVTMMPPVGSR